MNFTIIATCVSVALTVLAGLNATWQSSRVASIQLELQNEKLDRSNERITLQRAARAVADRQTQTLAKAQTAAAIRVDALAADSDRARSELERLRLVSETAVRNASAGIDACTSTLATHSQLLTQCGARLVEVAADADHWASHAVMLQDGWPK